MKKKILRFVSGVMALSLLLALLTACDKPGEKNENTTIQTEDIITQKVQSEDKIPVTVLVKYAFSINAFEKAAEEYFPQLDIIQVGNYTSDMGIAEYDARMKHGDLTDIVMTWPLAVGEQYFEERLLDLSALPLTSKYNNSMLNNISKDGKLYYLPGPSQVRSIVYNKTLFAENGWEVPTDFEEFILLCKEIEKSGIRSLQLGFKNQEVFDTAFIGYNYANNFSKPEDVQWIADYNNGKGSFGEHFDGALDIFQRLINEGVFKAEDLNVGYADREVMLFNRQCAMVEDSVLITRMGPRFGSTDEFALMPFFNPNSDGDWARLYPVCYIGINKDLAKAENKEKYDMVMKLMEYISTLEGQTTLAGDTGAMFSSLKGVPPPNIPEIDHLIPALTHGRYAIFEPLKNAQGALHKGLAGMVEGTLTKAEVIAMVDKENVSPPVVESPAILGKATESFSMIETGNFITDAMCAESGCEIALILDNGKDGKYNGKGICSKIYDGELTENDVKRIIPDFKLGEKGELWKITMTGEDLIKTLEYSIKINNETGNWFYYFSGLKMEIAPAAEPGKRIKKITDEKGETIDPNKLYSIAVMDESVPDEFIKSCEKTNILIKDILTRAFSKDVGISPSKDKRFVVVKP